MLMRTEQRTLLWRTLSAVAIDPVTEVIDVVGTGTVGDITECAPPQFVVQRDVSAIVIVGRVFIVKLGVIAGCAPPLEAAGIDEYFGDLVSRNTRLIATQARPAVSAGR